jgi:hypothetical protein
MIDPARCETCKAFSQNGAYGSDSETEGECRAALPVMMPDKTGAFPIMSKHDWCMHYQPYHAALEASAPEVRDPI